MKKSGCKLVDPLDYGVVLEEYEQIPILLRAACITGASVVLST